MSDLPDESPMIRCIQCSRMFQGEGTVCPTCAERPVYAPPVPPPSPTPLPLPPRKRREQSELKMAADDAWYALNQPLGPFASVFARFFAARLLVLGCLSFGLAIFWLPFYLARHRAHAPATEDSTPYASEAAPPRSTVYPNAPSTPTVQAPSTRNTVTFTYSHIDPAPADPQDVAAAIGRVNVAWEDARATANAAQQYVAGSESAKIAACFRQLVNDRIVIGEVLIAHRRPAADQQICEGMLNEIKAEMAALIPYMPAGGPADPAASPTGNPPADTTIQGNPAQDNAASQPNAPGAASSPEGATQQPTAGDNGESRAASPPPNGQAGQ